MNDRHAWNVGVVIPARNEEETIGACIQSVRTALRAADAVRRSWIVVVCNSCDDATQAHAAAALESAGQAVSCDVMTVGTARRLGASAVLTRFHDVPYQRIWLANTDADTCVTDDWLAQQLTLADQGAAGVAGIVSVETVAACSPEQVRSLLRDYETFADGSHPHVHGANLGVRGDAYLSVGGWSDKSVAEDHCLWNRLKEHRWPVVASTSAVVVTSGRLVGRAVGGFADLLRSRMVADYG